MDAIDYYKAQELKYKEMVDDQKVKAFRDTLGIAFVTFENDHIAARSALVSL